MRPSSYARPEMPCILCKETHRLWHCLRFKQMPPRDRLGLVAENKLCENCLLPTHDTKACGKRSVCSVPGCGQKHTMYIHTDNPTGPTKSFVGMSDRGRNVSNISMTDKKTYMPIVHVVINNRMKVFTLLDTGSSNSFCSSRLAKHLCLKGQSVAYHLNTLTESAPTKSKMVSLSLSNESGDAFEMSGVYVVHRIPAKTARIDTESYEHLNDITLPSFNDIEEVDLLIGQDYSEALLPLEVRKGKAGEPFGVRTILGWTVNGQLPVGKVGQRAVSHFVSAYPTTIDDNVKGSGFLKMIG